MQAIYVVVLLAGIVAYFDMTLIVNSDKITWFEISLSVPTQWGISFFGFFLTLTKVKVQKIVSYISK